MYLPSERVYKEMISEHVSLWFLPAFGGEFTIVLKAPSSTLKAIIKGCKITIFFSARNTGSKRILCFTISIYDDDVHPFLISGAIKEPEEQEALPKIIFAECTPFFLFDEVDRCVASTYASFNKNDAENLLLFLDYSSGFSSGSFDSEFEQALDCHDRDVELYFKNTLPRRDFQTIDLHTREFQQNRLDTIGDNESHEFRLDADNEGVNFEQSVWHILEWKFQNKIYRSPTYNDGRIDKELTDILAISDYGIFLVETKAMAVLGSPEPRTMDRKVAGVIKQVKKAIGQLKGAIATLRTGREIYSNGQLVSVPRDIVPHAIVLVSELLPYGDWDKVLVATIKASLDVTAYFHILDLRELALLAKRTDSVDVFDYNLMMRFKSVVNEKNLFIRGRFKSQDQA